VHLFGLKRRNTLQECTEFKASEYYYCSSVLITRDLERFKECGQNSVGIRLATVSVHRHLPHYTLQVRVRVSPSVLAALTSLGPVSFTDNSCHQTSTSLISGTFFFLQLPHFPPLKFQGT